MRLGCKAHSFQESGQGKTDRVADDGQQDRTHDTNAWAVGEGGRWASPDCSRPAPRSLTPKCCWMSRRTPGGKTEGAHWPSLMAGVPTDQTSLFPALQGPAWLHLQHSCSAATSTLPRFPRLPSCLPGDLLSSACSHHSQGPEGQGKAGLLCGHSAPWATTPPICQLGPLPYLWPRPWISAIDIGLSLRGTTKPMTQRAAGALKAAGSPLAWEGQPLTLVHLHMCTTTFAHAHTCTCARTHTPVHARTHLHTRIHTHAHTHTPAHAHTHTRCHPSCPQYYNRAPPFSDSGPGYRGKQAGLQARFLGRSGFLEATPASKPNYFRALHVTGWGQQLDHPETTHSPSRLAEPWLLGDRQDLGPSTPRSTQPGLLSKHNPHPRGPQGPCLHDL